MTIPISRNPLEQAVYTVEQIFGNPVPPLTEAQQQQLRTVLAAKIDTIFRGPYQRAVLGARNREIARRSLLDGHTLRQVADEFEISFSRVGQLRLKALRLLRHPTRSRAMSVIFKPAVHILHHGVALCGFSVEFGTPNQWPEGHSWVALEDKAAATCVRCGDQT